MSYLLWCTALNRKGTSSPGIAWQEGWHYSTCVYAASTLHSGNHSGAGKPVLAEATQQSWNCQLLPGIPISLRSTMGTELLASSKIWQLPNVFYLVQDPRLLPTQTIQLLFLHDLLADLIVDHSPHRLLRRSRD